MKKEIVEKKKDSQYLEEYNAEQKGNLEDLDKKLVSLNDESKMLKKENMDIQKQLNIALQQIEDLDTLAKNVKKQVPEEENKSFSPF